MNNRQDLCKLAAALGGLPVLGCRRDSPADRAGVVYGDILLSVNGRPTPDWSAYLDARALDPKAMVIEVFRAGEHRTLVVNLEGAMRPSPQELLAELTAERVITSDSVPPPPSDPN